MHTNRFFDEHMKLQDLRHKDQKRHRANSLKRSKRKQKLNFVYLNGQNEPEVKKSSRKKKKKKVDEEWGPDIPKKEGRKPTRTSGRLRKKPVKSYVFDYEDEEFNEMLSDGNEELAPKVEPYYKLERILSERRGKDGNPEYLSKLEGISYSHCQWYSETYILDQFGYDIGQRRLKAFRRDKKKIEAENMDLWEGDFFNPAFREVDRILSHQSVRIPVDTNGRPSMRFPTIRIDENQLTVRLPPPELLNGTQGQFQPKYAVIAMYLIKWKELSYNNATWELASDVRDEMKIAEFRRFNRPPVQYNLNNNLRNHNVTQWYTQSKRYKGGNVLRSYQVAGLNWLINCYINKRNGILADEMGLGKTVQIVSFLDHLKQAEQVNGPHLVVVPLSTLQNWRREVETWTDMNAVVYHDYGRRPARELMETYEFYYPMHKRAVKFNILITTYEIVQMDTQQLANIPWATLIVDEGHRLKNRNSKLLGDLRVITSARRRQPTIFLLTGTPIQNNAQELWALLHFIEPRYFASYEQFYYEYGDLKASSQVQKLQKAITPFVLRRMKESVERDIPPKEEIIIDIELTTLQKQYYRAVYERNAQFLRSSGSGKRKNNFNLVNIEIQLRKCCNHPWLLPGIEEKEVKDDEDGEGYFKQMIAASGKMVLLDKLLEKLKKEGHRVLIFSQMRSMLDILGRYMEYKEYKFERLDGGVTGNDRQRAIDRFCRPGSNRFVFLLSTRAGGVGLNLTQADTVIIFDIDWNPQQDMQAQARCHRIGQKKGVSVYRLVTRNTYESEMFLRASKKLGLDHAVLHDINKQGKTGMKEENGRPEDIDKILRVGVYGLLDNDDDKSKKFCESDINQILKTSSRVITSGKKRAPDVLATASVGNINYSKMRFESADADGSINIDDPDFWNKVLPGATNEVTASSLLAKLTGGGLSEKKDIDVFFEQLETLAIKTIAERNEGVMVQNVNVLGDLLIQVCSMSIFSTDQRRQAEEWGQELERRPRRTKDKTRKDGKGRSKRRGRKKSYYVESDYEEEEIVYTRKRKKQPLLYNSKVCDRCELPGNLLGCDGLCERYFKIEHLGGECDPVPNQNTVWRCCECAAQVHQCHICKEWGAVENLEGVKLKPIPDGYTPGEERKQRIEALIKLGEESERRLRRCSVSTCGKYFHLECIDKHEGAKYIGDVKNGYSSFRCPYHYCGLCKKSGNSKHLLNCLRCTNAFHVACLEEHGLDFKRITKKMMWCPECTPKCMEEPESKEILEAASQPAEFYPYKSRRRVFENSKKKRGRKPQRNKSLKVKVNMKRLKKIPLKSNELYNVKFKYQKQVILEQEWLNEK
eukprot:CAMPEP_0167764002 /NCGR_PEP_ID=MMETSP0110_2-20121227/13751_1 /TAXON_ID=629695 /ORGANISM="Gymnochlora sp., Strain CCMP2014" /LENGTH=1326 /DNA_ID=CAMNT_0007651279 /DNA_START=156 /DNA_END=4136 /DNA_ORIENTATION=+